MTCGELAVGLGLVPAVLPLPGSVIACPPFRAQRAARRMPSCGEA